MILRRVVLARVRTIGRYRQRLLPGRHARRHHVRPDHVGRRGIARLRSLSGEEPLLLHLRSRRCWPSNVAVWSAGLLLLLLLLLLSEHRLLLLLLMKVHLLLHRRLLRRLRRRVLTLHLCCLRRLLLLLRREVLRIIGRSWNQSIRRRISRWHLRACRASPEVLREARVDRLTRSAHAHRLLLLLSNLLPDLRLCVERIDQQMRWSGLDHGHSHQRRPWLPTCSALACSSQLQRRPRTQSTTWNDQVCVRITVSKAERQHPATYSKSSP